MKILLTLIVICWSFVPAYADDIENLRDYPHPIICKPFVEIDGGVAIAEQSEWVILTWASLEDITESTLIFKNKDGLFYVPSRGFVCSQ